MQKLILNTPYLIIISIFILLNIFALITEHPNITHFLKNYKQSFLLEEEPRIKNSANFVAISNQITTRLGTRQQFLPNFLISTSSTRSDTKNKKLNSLVNQLKTLFLPIGFSVKDGLKILSRFQARLHEILTSSLLETYSLPQAGVILGFVFGHDDLISEELRHKLKITGMSHIMSASGYNIGLLLSLTEPVINRFWQRSRSFLIFCLVIWCYIWIAGGSASLLRAGIMATLAYFGHRKLFFQLSPIRLLAVTFFLLFAVNRELAMSLSFQLSAGATLGLLLFMPFFSQSGGLTSILTGLGVSPDVKFISTTQKVLATLEEGFITTLMAQAFTVPLIWYHFQEFSLVSFVANPALLWITPIITSYGLAVSGLTLLIQPSPLEVLLVPLFWFAWILVQVLTQGLMFFGQFESGFWRLPELPLGLLLVWWGGLFGVAQYFTSRKRAKIKEKVRQIYAW